MTEFEIITLIMGVSAIAFALWVKPTNIHHHSTK
jgi:hypothetical protein